MVVKVHPVLWLALQSGEERVVAILVAVQTEKVEQHGLLTVFHTVLESTSPEGQLSRTLL